MRKFGSDRERRRRRADALYEFEIVLREEGFSDFVYDDNAWLHRTNSPATQLQQPVALRNKLLQQV
jgi:hypothetical protein